MRERIHNDPKREHMNNFYMHMPGGIYRLYEDQPKDSLAWHMQNVFKEYESFLDENSERWPEEEKQLIRVIKAKRDIQRELDKILEKDEDTREQWIELPDTRSGISVELEEAILRPVYIKLREKFAEHDLTS